MRLPLPLSCLLLVLSLQSVDGQSISLERFGDSIKHWQNQNDDASYARYSIEQCREIADNILLYQRENGGWTQNTDPLRILTEDEKSQLLGKKGNLDTSLDNRNTYPQIEYLAAAYSLLGDLRYKQGAERGLSFLFASQLESGGFTHSPPRTERYLGHITFMDEVMSGTLTTLRKVSRQEAPFEWVSEEIAERASVSVEKGTQLILKLQVEVDGKPTVWAGQYDANTLQPTGARSFELPSLVSWESIPVLKYLMETDSPSPEIVAAIENAVAWFEDSALSGIRIERKPIEPIRYKYHTAHYDPVVVKDESAPPIWARFYDLSDNSPLFANRKGERVATYTDIPHERRTGYAWYVTDPIKLLKRDYPKWRQSLESKKGGN
ncbi:pectate lyase [Pelagicoccus albus]|uniref:Pectate lyase n=1 Tax=Pelagicoccus albus TaxID=415222 RepID=A0A7X1B743_9BACT|nr:pectate lyase [Pelagicoccus albus]MBC2606871.1 pectate lyase [Pelagicoccus albus]